MMSKNFDFLRNFNNDLHYLACIIEDEIYDSPSAVLTDATTFMEIIVYEIFKKYDLTTESLQTFSDKVRALSEAKFISPELKKNLLKAYRLRNKMHSYNEDIKNHLNLNKNRAVRIHKFLFNASWLFYMEYCDDSFKVPQPSYIHPNRIRDELFDENGESKCIICENKIRKENESFCSDCDHKIEKCDNLKTFRKHFGFKNGFKRNQLVEMGFEKGYLGPLLMDLKNEGLIYVKSTLNYIDKDAADKYIKEVDDMTAVEKLFSDFKLKNISLNEVLNHEFYLKGKEGHYPFVALYNSFNRLAHSMFIKDLNSNMTIEEVLNKSYLTDEELENWYFNEKSSGSDEFLIFNEKFIYEFFAYKSKNMAEDEIKSKLKINESIFNSIRENESYYKQKEEQYEFSLFLKNIIQEGITKKKALKNIGLNEDDLDKLLRKYPEFRKRYEKSYTESRMKRFLNGWKHYDYDYALKKTGLVEEEIEDWVNKGQRMMKIDKNNVFSKFSKKYTHVLLTRYIDYRKRNKTRYKASKKLHKTPEEICTIINENKEYKEKLNKILVDLTINELKSEKTKEEIINNLDLDPLWLNSAIEKGKNGDELFYELYRQYSTSIVPKQIEEFLEMIKNRQFKIVLKDLGIDENDLNFWYEEGKNGNERFKDFYEEFFQYKKDRYIKTMMKTNSKNKALKKSYFTPDELLEYEDELEKEILDKSMETIMAELANGSTTKKACKKTPFKIDDIYDWLEMGMDGDEKFGEFAEVYREEYLIPIKAAYSKGIKEGISEKIIIKTMKKAEFIVADDIPHLKRLKLFPKPEDVVVEMDSDFKIDFD